LFAAGAVMTGVDIGVDISLVAEYYNNPYNEPYKGPFDSDTLSVSSSIFMILTACWIFLGGLVQTSVIIHLTRKNDPLVSDLPKPVRILVFFTAPILMAPVIVYIYGAYLIIKKKPENPRKYTEILNTKKLISALKAAETVFESVPQLCTQWGAVFLMVFLSEDSSTAEMNPLQALSITTSTTTLVLSMISRIPLTKPKQFIRFHYPVWASLAPLCLFLLSGVAAGTTQIRFLSGIFSFPTSISGGSHDQADYCFLWGIPLLSCHFSIFHGE
jgi:hypothetical protein